ncbi:glycosyltransferase [Paucihalobacter sp.]|uniref:glycosyltransferase n=1 Tax=Paucihalobacter sp. TaxID=2850405 RepID=UPI002FE02963
MKKPILVAPLNWGLGHATRCIPIINALIEHGFTPIIGSDGNAFNLLKQEFPKLDFVEMPSYHISYAKKAKNFKWSLIKGTPKMLKAIKTEKQFTKQLVKDFELCGIISDNRLGVYDKHISSVFITHQLNVLSGNTTKISSKLHQHIIKKFNECWVPDQRNEPSLSGVLGHLDYFNPNIKYLGPLSRFEPHDLDLTIDLLALLSGPEPQRTLLEVKLLRELQNYNGEVILVRGIVEEQQNVSKDGNITVYNFMASKELEKTINQSKLILSRSGYTTIMDLAKLNKKAFFIPTPGQFEQEYLAKKLESDGMVPYCNQDEFNQEKLNSVSNYKGLCNYNFELNYKKLFNLFQSE